MAAALRDKIGDLPIEVTVGDMATTRVPGTFGLVYCVFNSIFWLTSQEEQVQCFQLASEHLAPEGVFVIEAFVPSASELEGSDRPAIRAADVANDGIRLSIASSFPAKQMIENQTLEISRCGWNFYRHGDPLGLAK